MATRTVTTADTGCSARKGGYSTALPPASGGGFTSDAAWTSTELTYASVQDGANLVGVTSGSDSQFSYTGHIINLYIPTDLQGTTFSQLDYGLKVAAGNGNGNGWKYYIHNNSSGLWELIHTLSGSSLQLSTGTKTATLNSYINSSTHLVSLLAITSASYDGSASPAPFANVDYAYITLTYTGGTAWTSTLSEALAYTDGRASAPGKALAEALGLTDARAAGVGKIVSDALAYTDGRAAAASKVLAESLAVTDTRTSSAVKPLAEMITLTDALVSLLARALTQTLSEVLTFTEARVASTGKQLADALSLTDARSAAATHPLSEVLALTDGLASSMAGVLSLILTESLTFTDTRGAAAGKTIAESLTFIDVRSANLARTLLETLSMDAAVQQAIAGDIVKSLAEGLTFVDALTAVLRHHLPLIITTTNAYGDGTRMTGAGDGAAEKGGLA